MSKHQANLPRRLIDDIFEKINLNDLIDNWNYPVQAGREFTEFLKSGEKLDRGNNFLRPSRFSSFNKISLEDLFTILYPVFEHSREQTVENLISHFDDFIIDLKAQIQTTYPAAIYNGGRPKEDFGRQIVSAAIFGYFSREGFVYHEVLSGIGKIDILVCSDREIVVEAKLHRNFKPNSKQLEEYVQAGAGRQGYYFVFDTTKSFTHRKYCDIEAGTFPRPGGYSVIVCHVNPPAPSKV